MRTSISDDNRYVLTCEQAVNNDKVFAIFKSLPSYTEVLEHTSFEQGQTYLQCIQRDNPHLLEKIELFKTNDLYGNTKKMTYPGIGAISPSTLRYIKVLSDLIRYFKDLSQFKIAEIGVGYGGQCKIIQDYFTIQQYTLIDLPIILKLAEKYLTKFSLPVGEFKTMEELPGQEYDLVISNYAFTEIDSSIQEIYVQKVIQHSQHGYMTCNFISESHGIKSLSKMKLQQLKPQTKIYPEEPLTHPNNFILIW
jgi:putative sugar O-methyltransferase